MLKDHLFVFLVVALFFASCKHDLHVEKSHDVASQVVQQKLINYDTINYIMGRFDPSSDSRFTLIDEKYADRPGLYLRKEAYISFLKMHKYAQSEGVDLIIRSATRNFDYQKGIWERKWSGQTVLSSGINASADIRDPVSRALEILKYSSMPGTSRHHWGTDIDFNSFNNSWFEKGEGLRIYEWLKNNAGNYGFCQVYSPKGEKRPDGYNEEKWHWSYLPVASEYTAYAEQFLLDSLITGFEGSHTAKSISVVKKYVLGINPDCNKF